MDNTIEIMKEARKAGMQTACLMFACLCIIAGLFGYYIYKSYDNTVVGISAVQDGTNNNQEVTNGETIN